MKRSVAWAVKDSGKVPVSRVAARTLRKRFETVWSELRAASRGKHDPERVHQLRVATRRTLAALKAFQELVPKKQQSWLEKRLRQIRHAAGATRDLDVLTVELAKPSHDRGNHAPHVSARARGRLVTILAKRRDAARESIRAVYEKLAEDDWRGRVERLLDAVTSRSSTEPFLAYAQRRLPLAIDQFFKKADRRLRTADEIHRLRIAGKKLRYALEIFALAIPAATRTASLDALETLQETLGAFTDHAAAADRFRRWAREDGVGVDRATLVALRRHEDHQAKKARRVFVKWWRPSRRRNIHRHLEQTLGRVSA